MNAEASLVLYGTKSAARMRSSDRQMADGIDGARFIQR